MKKIIILILSISFNFSILAQPVLTADDFPENFTANAFRASTTGFNNGLAGENQIWDYSSIVITPTNYSMSVVPTSSVPFGTLIPTGNFTYEFNDNGLLSYNIHNLNSGSLEFLAYTETSSFQNYSGNSYIIFQFPYTFGANFTDTYQSSSSSQINTVNSVYDAFGTLITPFGIFTNVIRQKTISNSGNVSYNWMSTNPFHIILQGNFEDQIVYFWQSNNLFVEDFKIKPYSIYPNPTNDDFSIKNLNNSNKEVTITVFDGFGKAILKSQNTENDLETISLKNYASGLYFVKISDKNNKLIYSEKIIKY